jgi:hypothetical protein
VTVPSSSEYRGNGKATYVAETLYYGAHFSTPQGVQFTELYIELSDVRAWLMLEPSWESQGDSGDDRVRLRARDLGFRELLACSVKSINGSVAFRQLTTMRGGMWTCHLETLPMISIRPHEPQHFQYYRDVALRVVQLLTFLIGTPIYMARVRGVAALDQQNGTRRCRHGPPLIYFRHGYAGGAATILEHVVPFRKIRPLFCRLLNGWFDNAIQLGTAYDLAASILYNGPSPVETPFLMACHALENFHRATRLDQYIHSAKFQEIVRHVSCAIPKDTERTVRESLLNGLQWANIYSFRRRVRDLLGSLTPGAQHLITRSTKRFENQIVATRNALTHNDPRTSRGVAEGRALCLLLKSVQAVLLILLLREANVPVDFIVQCIGDTVYFKMWLAESKNNL